MRGYGGGTIFRARFELLLKAACKYFIKRPNQNLEGQFRALEIPIRGFGDRRGEVAHSIVWNLNSLAVFRAKLDPGVYGKPQWETTMAPFYALKQHGADGMPDYAYTLANMAALVDAMLNQWKEINWYRKLLLSPDQQQTKPLPRTSRKIRRHFILPLKHSRGRNHGRTVNRAARNNLGHFDFECFRFRARQPFQAWPHLYAVGALSRL